MVLRNQINQMKASTMKTNSMRVMLTIAAFTWVSNLQAQYTLDWFTVASGGGTVSGGDYTLDGIVGQPDAGNLSGGGYAVEGGFWAGVIAGPGLSITRAGAEAVLSWTGSGFILQSAAEVSGPWADFSPGVTTDGVRYEANATISGRKKFFRLRGQ
jgi:hypothetical protein